MISQCMNPECSKELHYLRNGRVIRTTRRIGSEIHVEHFWLCGDCYVRFDFLFAKDGRVSLAVKPRYIAVSEPALDPALDLLLVS